MTQAVDSFSVGCLISELLLGVPLFCPCPDGPHYLQERLAVSCHILGPFEHSFGAHINQEHPGMFSEDDFTNPILPGVVSESTLLFLQTTEPLDVCGIIYLSS